MLYLLLAIAASTVISVGMRMSTGKVTGDLGMLAANYGTCLIVSLFYTGPGSLFPAAASLPSTLVLGAVQGVIYLLAFMLLQRNVQRNGVVLSATFMKLGLLVNIVLSLLLFGEKPGVTQVIGFVLALAAIVLINYQKGAGRGHFPAGLLLLLLAGGCADAMSKVFEFYGDSAMADQFLVYTFFIALVLCIVLAAAKKERIGKAELFYGALVGIPNYFSARFLIRALQTVPAVVAYPTYSAATLLTVTVIGVAAFREKLRKTQIIAIAVILAALVLLNIEIGR